MKKLDYSSLVVGIYLSIASIGLISVAAIPNVNENVRKAVVIMAGIGMSVSVNSFHKFQENSKQIPDEPSSKHPS